MKVWIALILVLSGTAFLPTLVNAQSELSPQLRSIADSIVEAQSERDAKELVYRSLIFEFAKHGRLDVFRALDSRGADWRIRDEQGRTLLHVAAAGGHAQLVRYFLQHGVEIDRLNQSERSTLFEATVEGQTEIVKLLLERGADVNGNSKTNHPINAAAWYGHTEILQLLLAQGADHGERDADRNTALHKAVWQGNIECVFLLLQAGANINAKNSAGQTPISMANERALQVGFDSDARPWGIEQVLGPPDAGDAYSDREWAPSTDSGTNEWLEVSFGQAVDARKLEIFAKPKPASINKVTAFDSKGEEFTLWEGDELQSAKGRSSHIAVLEIKSERPIERVKIYLSSAKVSGWVYYDAVGLGDADGKVHWATWANSSTCYAQGPIPEALVHRRILNALQQK